jgi:hypothetical protein
MAYEQPGIVMSFTADEDLSSFQYRFVVLSGNDSVRLANAAADYPVGILQNAPESGELAEVAITGVSKLVANAATTVGTLLKNEYVGAADNGKGDAADTDYDLARAVCLMAAGAEDDVMSVLLINSKIMVA